MKYLGVTLIWILATTVCRGDSYRAYPGERQASEEVVLSLPAEIVTLKIDGVAIRKRGRLLGAAFKELLLLPGSHELTVRYEELWDHDQGDDFEKLRSKPITVSFNAQTPGEYLLIHSRPESLPEAQALEKSFSPADLSFQKAGDAASVPAAPEPKPATAPQSTVDVLKYWWEKTSDDERETFLKWIENSP